MAMSGDTKISPAVFSLSTMEKSSNTAASVTDLTSNFRIAARRGGSVRKSSRNHSICSSAPCAYISTYGPLLHTVPVMPTVVA